MTAQRWTPKRAVARSRKNLAGAIVRLNAVAREWGDIDQCFVEEAGELARALAEFADRIDNDIRERVKAGEQIGI